MGSSSSSTRRSPAGSYPASRNRINRPHASASGQRQPPAGSVNLPAQRNSPANQAAPPASSANGSTQSPAPAPSSGSSQRHASSISSSAQSSGSSQGGDVTLMDRPGAYSITRQDSGPTQVFRVQIPLEVGPGQQFRVIAGSRTVTVRCPRESRGGHYLQITVPPEPVVSSANSRGMAVLTSATDQEGGGAVRMNDEARVINEEQERVEQAREEQLRRSREQSQQPSGNEETEQPTSPPQQPTTYMVTVPRGISPGMQFAVEVNGQRMMVTCPPNVQAGMNLRIVPPRANTPVLPRSTGTSLDRPPEQQQQPRSNTRQPLQMQMFEVVVPAGVQPNQQFSLIANGQRVLVTCPPNVSPGQKVRFELPIRNGKDDDSPAVHLDYEDIKDGWCRTLRVTDYKFQWIRMDEDGEIDLTPSPVFDIKHSALTRRLVFLQGNDARMRTGKLSLGPANESWSDSSVHVDGKEVINYTEIAAAQQRPRFEDKSRVFQEMCREKLRVDWSEGHMRVLVRRQHLLHDSIDAVMSLSRDDMRKIWRFEFMSEVGVDAGGLAREWFELVSKKLFDPDFGLFLPSATNQMAMRINPDSELACPEDHLIYFRFLGRVMGKALFDGQLIAGHMVRHLYKHILGWPVMFEDLEIPDEEYYNNLKSLLDLDNVEDLCLNFTFTETAFGVNRDVELVEGGEEIDVTNDNLPEFLEANFKYHLMDRVKPQLTELLLGFYDVIPEPLLTMFDFQELELLMSGLPEIDVDDWMANTLYQGQFERRGAMHKSCQWFWEVVREFDHAERAKLLQFTTGSSGVPARGFSVLQGNDGNIKKFALSGIRKEQSLFPRAHTCFNRIDLPCYSSKEELREKLKIALATSVTGFDIE